MMQKPTRFVAALVAMVPQFVFAQHMVGNLSAAADVRTEGVFLLTNPSRTNAIRVFVKVAYKGGEFQTKLMPDGKYQLVLTKPPVVEPGSYLGYREEWIYKKDGSIDLAKSREGMLVQKIVGIGSTTMGTAYIVKGQGFDLAPAPGDTSVKHSILDSGKSLFSASDANVQDYKGRQLSALRTTTTLPIAGVPDAAQQIYIVRDRDRQGLPLMISTSQFAGAAVNKVANLPAGTSTK